MKRLLSVVRSIHLLGISGLALSLCPPVASAAAVSATCQPGSLQTYINATGSCSVGSIQLSGFSNFTATAVGNPPLASPSTITVTPITGPNGAGGFALTAMQNGTNYFAIPNPTSAQSVTYSFNYFLDPFLGEIGLDPPVGLVTATQNYCVGDVFNDACAHGTLLSQTVTTNSPNSTIVLSTTPMFVDVNTVISLEATPGNPAGFDALNILYGMGNGGTATPEPGSLLLMGVGLALLMSFPAARKLRAR